MPRKLATYLDEWFFLLVRQFFRYSPGPYRPVAPAASAGLLASAAAGRVAGLRLQPHQGPNWTSGTVTVQQFRFDSPIASDGAAASGRLFVRDRHAPWCVILPGYLTGLFGTEYGIFLRAHARAAVEDGFNAALLAPPYHLERTPAGTFSGAGFFTADLGSTAAAIAGWVSETVALADWLRAEYGQPVGIWGCSLGGLCAGLAATVRGDWAYAVFHEPLGDVAAALWLSPAAADLRAELAAHGTRREDFARMLAPLCPPQLGPQLDQDRMLFMIPQYDGIVPTASQVDWWQAWGRPARVDLDTGHLRGAAHPQALQAAVAWARRTTAAPLAPAPGADPAAAQEAAAPAPKRKR